MVNAPGDLGLEGRETLDESTIVADLIRELRIIEQEQGTDQSPGGAIAANGLKEEVVQRALVGMMTLNQLGTDKITAMTRELPQYLRSHSRSIQNLSSAAALGATEIVSLQLRGMVGLYMGWLEKNRTSLASKRNSEAPKPDPTAEVAKVTDNARQRIGGGGLELDPATRRQLGVQAPGIDRIPKRGSHPRGMWQTGKAKGDDGKMAA